MTAPLFVRAAVMVDRLFGQPMPDPLLDPAGAEDPNPLDDVDPAWGLPAGHQDFPARVAERRNREACEPCAHCEGTGYVATYEDGGAGFRPCHRCPQTGDAA